MQRFCGTEEEVQGGVSHCREAARRSAPLSPPRISSNTNPPEHPEYIDLSLHRQGDHSVPMSLTHPCVVHFFCLTVRLSFRFMTPTPRLPSTSLKLHQHLNQPSVHYSTRCRPGFLTPAALFHLRFSSTQTSSPHPLG